MPYYNYYGREYKGDTVYLRIYEYISKDIYLTKEYDATWIFNVSLPEYCNMTSYKIETVRER